MSHAMSEQAKLRASSRGVETDMEKLRYLLFGKDYQELLALNKQLSNPQLYSEKVAGVVSEALTLRLSQDKSLGEVLSPTVEGALTDSIERDPARLANALYPVMGPAIRKSINEVLSQTFETFNQLLEQSLSPRSLLWRLDAWRTGRSYPEVVLLNTLEYQVEQVFLIHRESGLLLRHAVSPKAMSKDPDMVSGMLTAIQDFIADSFDVEDGESLSRLRLGELTVLVEPGPYAVIAAVIRGNVPGKLPDLLKQTQEDVHRQMTNTLLEYEGDSGPFVRIHPLLEQCLLIQVQKKEKRTPWLMYLVLLGLLGGLAGWWYMNYQAEQTQKMKDAQWQTTLDEMNAEPGVVVIAAKQQGGSRSVRGLLDPLARHPRNFVGDSLGADTTFSFKPYLSAEPGIVLRRTHQILQPPENTGLALNKGVLEVSGNVDKVWRDKLDQLWPNITGITALDDSGLTVIDVTKQQQQRLIQQIETTRHYFAHAGADLNQNDQQVVVQAERIKQLMTLVQQQSRVLQVSIMGNTDQTGNQKINTDLAKKRALNVYQRLIDLGVPSFVLSTYGVDVPIKMIGVHGPSDNSSNERSVHYLINLY